MRTLKVKVTFQDASKLTRLQAGETPPAHGWAIGPDGAFHNGKLESATPVLRPGGRDAEDESRRHKLTELLIFEDEPT